MDVVIASPWVPAEWIAAHGHQPKGVWLHSARPAPFTTEGVCPVAHLLAEIGTYAGDGALILPTTCDQMRRAADAARLGRHSRLFLFNVPATWQTPAARMLYHDEMHRLGRFLNGLGGRTPSAPELARTTARFNLERTRITSFVQHHPGRVSAEAMAGFFEGELAPESPEAPPTRANLVPIALLGGPVFPPEWPLFDAIETAGGSAVLNCLEPGERCLCPPVPIPEDGLTLAGLADHYFDNMLDVFRRPNLQLYSWLAPRLKARKVGGIILWVRVGCDLWRAEAATLREKFGLPVLVLDSHRIESFSSATPCLRDVNRITAFVESLQ